MDYRQAGVDVEAGREFVSRIRQQVESTFRPEVIGGIGGFAGLFEIPAGYKAPVLVSGTDGVGTKLKIAQAMDRHHTIGIDLVAMCVNDILTTGAEPLYFLDYLATGKLEPAQLADVVTGIVEGCKQSGCALLGGETAEMPGFYGAGEYDAAGFAVGIVEKAQLLNGSQVQIGDVAIAVESSGVHSNGFSLVRKIIDSNGWQWSDCLPGWGRKSLGEIFLEPTRIYVKPIQALLKSGINVHGMAHITGGGLPENLPRCLGPGQSVQVKAGSWQPLPVFNWLAEKGQVNPTAMLETFNLGVGFVVIVAPDQGQATLDFFQGQGLVANPIGEVIEGDGAFVWLD
ncbi:MULTISPECIES: phosphoribosylformylglycinamidine cyclo-ligase [unclassified Synechocystis]|uniref:phosphoribosylformylglycinamidine cyclo-ligase n=1 Tax=unclassified Synechocystis TaxID=2640012 RepID=UPI00040A1F17|nr:MULTISPECIES: phosphoribosylformylglycinamidine cyclo-ligase [unclassified Synechocystis]AIE76030.1 Phosphoribosylformylglycinamidine cyclo-ligase [Synechocystis sp. PCC 6714]MCT0255064.1 phosphoribosylformylglycinamidine cyclo-ligase [Synechocystis sp. CS-94]